jgi:hypothetical protein
MQQLRILQTAPYSADDILALLSATDIAQFSDAIQKGTDTFIQVKEWNPHGLRIKTHLDRYKNFKFMHHFPYFWKVVQA